MRILSLFFAGSTSCVMRAGAVAMALYVLDKSQFTCLTKNVLCL